MYICLETILVLHKGCAHPFSWRISTSRSKNLVLHKLPPKPPFVWCTQQALNSINTILWLAGWHNESQSQATSRAVNIGEGTNTGQSHHSKTLWREMEAANHALRITHRDLLLVPRSFWPSQIKLFDSSYLPLPPGFQTIQAQFCANLQEFLLCTHLLFLPNPQPCSWPLPLILCLSSCPRFKSKSLTTGCDSAAQRPRLLTLHKFRPSTSRTECVYLCLCALHCVLGTLGNNTECGVAINSRELDELVPISSAHNMSKGGVFRSQTNLGQVPAPLFTNCNPEQVT